MVVSLCSLQLFPKPLVCHQCLGAFPCGFYSSWEACTTWRILYNSINNHHREQNRWESRPPSGWWGPGAGWGSILDLLSWPCFLQGVVFSPALVVSPSCSTPGWISPGEAEACKPQSWCCRMRARGPAEQASSRFRDFLQTQRWMPRNRFFLKMNHSEMHKENPFALNRQIMFLTGALLQVNLLWLVVGWESAGGTEKGPYNRTGTETAERQRHIANEETSRLE